MFRVLVVSCAIGFVSCHTHLNVTTSDVKISGIVTLVSELITNSVTEDGLAIASTESAWVLGLNSTSTEDSILNHRHCPTGSSKPCVVKCCPLGQSIGPDKICEESDLEFQVPFFFENGTSNATVDENDYDFIFGNPCAYERFRLEPMYDSIDEFHILRNGTLRAPYLYDYLLGPNEYCLEVFLNPDTEEEEIFPLVCFQKGSDSPPPSRLLYVLYPVGLLISVPFLIFTMLAYCLIPELRDLHGKSLICHVMCLTVAYICLAAVQLGGETFSQGLCVGVAFIIQFSFLACFFWLNVLCFNMWWNVVANVKLQQNSEKSTQNSYQGYILSLNNEVNMTKENERKYFIFYSLYAWCFPIAILVVSMISDLMPIIPSSYLKPNFGNNKCWFSSEEAELPYFYGPVAVIICVNVILFFFTASRIYCHKLRTPRPKPRQLLFICFCLFCVMGINWVMEIVSWFCGGPDYIWYVTDIINTLQGVIIFAVCILEPGIRSCVWKKLEPKLSKLIHRKHTPHFSVSYSSPEDAVALTTK